jgi:hypothetical protein
MQYVKGNYVKDAAWQGVSETYLSELEEELGWHLCVVARRSALPQSNEDL